MNDISISKHHVEKCRECQVTDIEESAFTQAKGMQSNP